MDKVEYRKNWGRLPLDTNMRYFVVGDIHGRMTTFVELLEKINYDPTRDYILSVGDLIDRGPDSIGAVKFFSDAVDDGCYAIRGNHEQFLVNMKEWYGVWMIPQNGGPATMRSLGEHQLSVGWLESYCKATPIMLDVGKDDDPLAFRLVHAECPFTASEGVISRMMNEVSSEQMGETELLWGRDDITACLRNTQALRPAGHGIFVHPERTKRRVFCGHTPVHNPIAAHNTIWLDTFRGHTLTCYEVLAETFHSVQVRD